MQKLKRLDKIFASDIGESMKDSANQKTTQPTTWFNELLAGGSFLPLSRVLAAALRRPFLNREESHKTGPSCEDSSINQPMTRPDANSQVLLGEAINQYRLQLSSFFYISKRLHKIYCDNDLRNFKAYLAYNVKLGFTSNPCGLTIAGVFYFLGGLC
jgi:hypothetical protein